MLVQEQHDLCGGLCACNLVPGVSSPKRCFCRMYCVKCICFILQSKIILKCQICMFFKVSNTFKHDQSLNYTVVHYNEDTNLPPLQKEQQRFQSWNRGVSYLYESFRYTRDIKNKILCRFWLLENYSLERLFMFSCSCSIGFGGGSVILCKLS